MKVALKVVPGSSRDEISGWLGDDLKVRVRAPAENGKANTAVKKVLAAALTIPVSSIEIVSGGTLPRKVVEISSLTKTEMMERLPGDTT